MTSGRLPDQAQRRRVVALREQGLTCREIGERLGISKQAVHQLLSACGVKGHVTRTVYCRRCRGAIHSGGVGLQMLGPVYCLKCLARLPEPTFAERLRAFRLAAGLSMRQLSERSGVKWQQVADYEHGRAQPKWDSLLRLMRVLGPEFVTLGLKPPVPGGKTPPRAGRQKGQRGAAG